MACWVVITLAISAALAVCAYTTSLTTHRLNHANDVCNGTRGEPSRLVTISTAVVGSEAALFGIASLVGIAVVIGGTLQSPRLGARAAHFARGLNCLAISTLPAAVCFMCVLFFIGIIIIIFGVGLGGEMSAFLVINRQYYGMGPVRTVFGFQNLGAGLGMALGGLLGGVVYDFFGSYNIAWAISIAASLGGAGLILSLESTTRMLIPDWEESLPAEARTPATAQAT